MKIKKIYLVEWAYDSQTSCIHKELVEAYNIVDAWDKIKKEHCISICLRNIVPYEAIQE